MELERIVKLATRQEARSVEQALISGYGLENLLNKINSISPTRETFEKMLEYGEKVHKEIKYGWH